MAVEFRRAGRTRVLTARRSVARLVTVVIGVVLLAVSVIAGSASAAPTRTEAKVATAKVATARVTTASQDNVGKAVLTSIPQHKTARVCAKPKAGHLACDAIRQTDTVEPSALKAAAIVPSVTPSGYGPTNLQNAYKLATSGSASSTVAIVDAYNDPNAESDLAAYRAQFGLPACTTANGCFKKVNQNGATSPLPTGDTGWAGEISLDVQMISAICPNCHILLVEANSAANADLYAAEDYAATGAKFVSNSWGGSEYSGETTDDSHFHHPGVAITASTGDDGYGISYPASSQYVTAVGGTSLTTSTNARGWNETAWSGAGSGCSTLEAKPAVQSGVTTNCAKRADADVSAVADPNTGVAVYQTYGASGWVVYGGTSVAAPIIAGVYALAGNPGAADTPNAYPYAHTASLFDVTSGNNGSCGTTVWCTAGAGWDGPTGLGTPNGTAAFSAGAAGVVVNNPGSQVAKVGTPFSLTLTASGGTSTYTWSATGLPSGLTINPSTGTISGTPTTAGTYSVTATAMSGSQSGSTTFTMTVSTSTGLCTSAQLLGNPGFETGSAPPWTSTAGVVNPNGAGETSHSGTYYAWLDGYGTTHTDTITQSVTIPAACTNTTLSFWLHIDTAETTTTTAFDKLTVKIGATTLATYSNLNHATGYSQKSFNVGASAGQNVTVSFSGTEDSSLQTSFVIDDTAVSTG